MLGLCLRTGSAVTPFPIARGAEGLAAILQVTLLLHFPPHGGIPVVLDGVVRTVRESFEFLKCTDKFLSDLKKEAAFTVQEAA